jgi:CheY-like chemotaxis protein
MSKEDFLDLVVLDIRLPGISGIEVVHKSEVRVADSLSTAALGRTKWLPLLSAQAVAGNVEVECRRRATECETFLAGSARSSALYRDADRLLESHLETEPGSIAFAKQPMNVIEKR